MKKPVNNKVRKPVSFNKTKPRDVEMLKYLGRRNFSGYMKKLIQADMLVKSSESVEEQKIPTPGLEGVASNEQTVGGEGDKKLTVEERLSIFNERLKRK